jgi:hypothetical protein
MPDPRPASLRSEGGLPHRLPGAMPAPTGPARALAQGAIAGRVGAQPPTPTGSTRYHTTVGRAPGGMILHGERRQRSIPPTASVASLRS